MLSHDTPRNIEKRMNSPQISLVPKIPGTEVRYETFKKTLVQTVLCQAAALDLRNGRATVLALRPMQYDNALRLVTVEGKTSLNALKMQKRIRRGPIYKFKCWERFAALSLHAGTS